MNNWKNLPYAVLPNILGKQKDWTSGNLNPVFPINLISPERMALKRYVLLS